MNIIQMTHADYLSDPAYGASDIIKMSRSFAYYKYRKDNPEKKGRPLVVGGAFHLMLQNTTEGKKEHDGILLYEGGSSQTKAFKDFQEKNPNLYCLDQEETRLCGKMLKAVLAEPEVMGYLTGAIAEPTIMANYPGTNIKAKCRPDYLHKGRGVSINIKTTTDASESGFLYAARDYGYDWQSAFYCDILTAQLGKQFDEVHILVEKTDDDEPCPVGIYSFGDETLAFARGQLREVLEKIPACEKTGIWPKNKPYLKTVDLPMFMRRAVEL